MQQISPCHVERRHHNIALELERQFFGFAKVSLEQLRFSKLSFYDLTPGGEHLGVPAWSPLAAKYHLPAIVNHEQLLLAVQQVGASVGDLSSHNSLSWPDLTRANGLVVQCLRGKTWVDACKQSLNRKDWWCILKLYSEGKLIRVPHARRTNERVDASPALRDWLEIQQDGGFDLSPSMIVYRYLQHRFRGTAPEADARFAGLRPNMRNDVTQFLTRPLLSRAFEQVSELTPLFVDLQPGNLRRVFGCKCDEEISNYVDRIRAGWSIVGASCLDRFDVESVRRMARLHPSSWTSESEAWTRLCCQGDFLPMLDQTETELVGARLDTLDFPILTFQTFHQDFRYFHQWAACLCRLVNRKTNETVRATFRQRFQHDAGGMYCIDEDTHTDCFDVAFRELYLFVIRNNDRMLTEQGFHRLTKLAVQLGFATVRRDKGPVPMAHRRKGLDHAQMNGLTFAYAHTDAKGFMKQDLDHWRDIYLAYLGTVSSHVAARWVPISNRHVMEAEIDPQPAEGSVLLSILDDYPAVDGGEDCEMDGSTRSDGPLYPSITSQYSQDGTMSINATGPSRANTGVPHYMTYVPSWSVTLYRWENSTLQELYLYHVVDAEDHGLRDLVRKHLSPGWVVLTSNMRIIAIDAVLPAASSDPRQALLLMPLAMVTTLSLRHAILAQIDKCTRGPC